MRSFLYSCLVSSLFAGFTPGNPYGDSVWPVGTTQTITWKWEDKAGDASFKDINKLVIDFMTGSDENNELISNIATVSPSDTELQFKIPDVPKDGKIYFIRLIGLDKSGKDVQYNWSTRFTIKGSSGKPTSDPTTVPATTDKDKPTKTSDEDDKDKPTKTSTSDKDKPTKTSTNKETSTATETTTTTKAKTTTTTTKSSYVPTPESSASTLAISSLGLLSAALVAFL